MKLIITIIVIAILSGCVNLTYEELENKPAAFQTYSYSDNYEVVYKRILEKMSQCYNRTSAGFRIENAIYPESSEARVSLAFSNMNGQVYLLIVKVNKLSEKRTVVKVYGSSTGQVTRMNSIGKWANNEMAECEA